jgi:hypothetical protein
LKNIFHIANYIFTLLLIFNLNENFPQISSEKKEQLSETVYGDKYLGFFFKSKLTFRLPTTENISFPQKEYWHKDGKLWIYNASVKNRNLKKKSDIEKVIKDYFFPGQVQQLKKIPQKAKKSKQGVLYSGKIKIHEKPYRVFMKYYLDDKYLHIIFIFYLQKWETNAKEIFKSVSYNPNFFPF